VPPVATAHWVDFLPSTESNEDEPGDY
jgi:hypothetical protein